MKKNNLIYLKNKNMNIYITFNLIRFSPVRFFLDSDPDPVDLNPDPHRWQVAVLMIIILFLALYILHTDTLIWLFYFMYFLNRDLEVKEDILYILSLISIV